MIVEDSGLPRPLNAEQANQGLGEDGQDDRDRSSPKKREGKSVPEAFSDAIVSAGSRVLTDKRGYD